MTKVVNLNKVRKQKAREAASLQAAENRVKFGRTKEQKALDAAQVDEARAKLDRLKRTTLPDDAGDPEQNI